MLKIKNNTDLENIYAQMVIELIKSKKNIELLSFAKALEQEMKNNSIVFQELVPLKEEATSEEEEKYAKAYIKAFICMPHEKLQQIFLNKKNDFPKNDFESQIGDLYEDFSKGILANRLSDDYLKETWGKFCNKDSKDEVRIKPYRLIEGMQKIWYCPYCNSRKVDSREKIVGGELDHFYPKSIIPLLALCLYNFVPACEKCNNIKRDKLFFQSPYDLSYDIETVHFQSTYNPIRLDDDVRTVVIIEGKEYHIDDLREREIEEANLPILNNFIHMDILSEYSRNAGDAEVRQIISTMIAVCSQVKLRTKAEIVNRNEEYLLKQVFGELLEDDKLLLNQKGKYKRDLLCDNDIIKKENGKYKYNV